MTYNTINEVQYQEDKKLFLDGLLAAISHLFYGRELPASMDELVALPGQEDKTGIIERILDAIPKLVDEGLWDVNACDLGADAELFLRGCAELLETVFFRENTANMHGDFSDEFLHIIKIAHARARLDFDLADSSIEEIALLAGMNERSVRNALYADGAEKLVADNTGHVATEEAVRWLSQRRNFKATRFYNSRVDSQDFSELDSSNDLLGFIVWQAKRLDITPAIFAEVTEGEWSEKEATMFLDTERGFLRDGIFLLDSPGILMNLARLLKWNPSWFVKTAMDIKAKEDAEDFLYQQRAKIEDTLNTLGLSKDFSDQPEMVDPSTLATAGSIRALIGNTPGIRRHPKDKGGNAKIDAYVAENGRAIAHEYNLKQQSLWVEAKNLNDQSFSLKPTIHPANRHSGLGKYPELAQPRRLLKFRPETVAEANEILEAVMNAAPVDNTIAQKGK